ncbi:beta-aspartyl-peptidase (threonine type) [Natronospira proteinivora]|uniref:Beta-aspartyl-peptidase (Threonine type) n=1 Tax=Natronospira proteinivora TaxID=1807133 RepID=A0ABT1G8M6_9GAMM|nr:isoaspartyl peptidase/L-asparaginase [Natronospira proteinivora]MCP1727676.1 beta-aspartyl-peptidase (threonine type) [Natronospira proteinivora]
MRKKSLTMFSLPLIGLTLGLGMAACGESEQQANQQAGDERPIGLAVHGGAGTMAREDMSEEQEAEYHDALKAALEAGYTILENGGESLDAVQAAIRVLEDSPLFNAGRGSVFTSDEQIEMDAAIMDGRDLNAGALTGVRTIRNPIDLARVVMDESPHVFFSGDGAETYGEQFGLATEDPEWFETEHRREALRRAQEAETEQGEEFRSERDNKEFNLGTVGAVALDENGNVAAGTSTGGMTNKRFGRIGDVPIVGGGTYANNETGAFSATGHGEYIMRAVTLHDISSLMAYRGMSVEEAADHVVNEKLVDMGGNAGVIAIDAQGNITMPHNTSGMYRGSVDAAGNKHTAIFADD